MTIKMKNLKRKKKRIKKRSQRKMKNLLKNLQKKRKKLLQTTARKNTGRKDIRNISMIMREKRIPIKVMSGIFHLMN